MQLPGFLQPHTVAVEPPAGDSSEGPTYGPPVVVRCRVEGRIDVTGDGQHVGSVKVYTILRHRDKLLPGARVTLPQGGAGIVSAAAAHEDGGLGAWEHLEVTITGGLS